MVAGNLARVVALIAVVLGAGALAGMAFAYPLRSLDLGGSDAVTLDQEALANTIDVEQALVAVGDLPTSYVEADPAMAASVKLIGAKYCGLTPAPDDQVGEPLAKAFVDSQNNALLISEVMRVRRQNDAGAYIRELTRVFDGCSGQKYFTGEGESKVRLQITNPRNDAPLETDYVSRTLTPVEGGTTQIVTYFQVGNVIVAIQYAGPANPRKDLMGKAELEILYRVAPDQLSKTAKVNGAQPLPDNDATTTTVTDAVQPSPTSSPPIPTTVAPPPTFEPTTTTKKSTKKATTTAAPVTTVP